MRLQLMLIGLSLFACVNVVHAQSFFEDTRGNATLLLLEADSDSGEEPHAFATKNRTTLFLNGANDSGRIQYIWQEPDCALKLGIIFSGKATSGLTSVVEEPGRPSEIIGNIFIGFGLGKSVQNIPTYPPKHQFILRLGLCQGAYNLLAPVLAAVQDETGMDMKAPAMQNGTDETYTKTQTAPSVFLHYNLLLKKNLQAGLAIGYARQNNIASLPAKKIVKSQPLAQTGADSAEKELILSQKTVRDGEFEEFDTLNLNADLLYVPNLAKVPKLAKYKFGIDIFLRYTYRGGNTHLFEPGIGIFNIQGSDPPQESETNEKNTSSLSPNCECAETNAQSPVSNASVGERDKPNCECTETNLRAPSETGGSRKIVGDTRGKIVEDTPGKIVYGVISQWDSEAQGFRSGVVVGYNF